MRVVAGLIGVVMDVMGTMGLIGVRLGVVIPVIPPVTGVVGIVTPGVVLPTGAGRLTGLVIGFTGTTGLTGVKGTTGVVGVCNPRGEEGANVVKGDWLPAGKAFSKLLQTRGRAMSGKEMPAASIRTTVRGIEHLRQTFDRVRHY